MYREFDVEDLHKQFDPDIGDYDEEWDEIPSYINGEDHFVDLAQWAIKAMGFKVKAYSYVFERDYSEGWCDLTCPATARHKLKAKLNENTVEHDYYTHFIVERQTWSLEDDGSLVSLPDADSVMCVKADSGGETIYIEEHAIGKCPHLIYYHEVHKTLVKRVDVTLYVKVTCADEEDVLDSSMEDAIEETLYNISDNLYDCVRDYVEDNIDTDVYYDGDIAVKMHKQKIADVKRMPS